MKAITMKTMTILKSFLEILEDYNTTILISRITSLLQNLTEFSRMFHCMLLEGSSIHVTWS